MDRNALFKPRVLPPTPAIAPKPPRRPPPAPSREASLKEPVHAPSGFPQVQALIGVKDIKLGEELGEGEFGSVLRGTWQSPEGESLPVSHLTCTVYMLL